MKQIVSEYAAVHSELSLEIECFSNPFAMLEEIGKSGVPDIALLDICMPGVLGTEIAPGNFEQKRKQHRYCLFDYEPRFCGGGFFPACQRLSDKAVHQRKTD